MNPSKRQLQYLQRNKVNLLFFYSLRTYIAQPFAKGSTIRLMEDYGSIPQFKESLHGAPELKNGVMKVSSSSAISSALEDFDSQEYIKGNNEKN